MNEISSIVADEPSKASSTRSFIIIGLDNPKAGDRLAPGKVVTGSGWVVADAEVTEIAVYLDDRLICYATYGIPRPEIAERYPHYPHVEQSGFSFSTRLDPDIPVTETAYLAVHVSTATGSNIKQAAVMVGEPKDDEEAIRSAVASVWPIRITVEHALIDGTGILRVSGWVVSLAPLQVIRLSLGDTPLAAPEIGLLRPDVAREYPTYPGAEHSGFKLIQDISGFEENITTLRVQAHSAGGIKRQVILPIAQPRKVGAVVSRDNSIHMCVDEFSMRSDGTVAANGWAVSAAGISVIGIEIDGKTVGTAELGRERPDVGNQFPRIQSARRSGFSFKRKLDEPLEGEHLLEVRVQDGEGKERRVQLPALAEQVAVEIEDPGILFDTDEIRFNLDSPVIENGRATQPVTGTLNIAGWALSRAGIERVEVFLDEQSLGNAYVGMRREDVGSLFPDIEGALRCGYALTVPHRRLGEGERIVRVAVQARDERTTERSFTISVQKGEEVITAGRLRTRAAQSEVDLALSVLKQVGYEPQFIVVLRAGARDEDGGISALRATVATLAGQAYGDWRAVIVSPVDAEAPALEDLIPPNDAETLARVRLAADRSDTLPEVQQARLQGRPALLCVLQAGDLLGADALLKFAVEGALSGGADLLYSDDRRIDIATGAVAPFFKPDWSPELLMSMNYFGRAWAASDTLVERADISLGDLASASDYDLALRLAEHAEHIRHIPVVLGDMASVRDDELAERSALESAVDRNGLDASVLPGRVPGTWRVKRSIRSTAGMVSIIMPTCAARGLIEISVNSIRALSTYRNFEIVVLDNIPDSLPEWKAWVREHADKVIDMPEKFNWSRFNNIGVAHAAGEFLLFLNDDIEVLDPNWLETLIEQADRPEIGVVGPQLLYPDHKVQHAGMFLAAGIARHAFRFAQENDPGSFGLALTQRNMVAVTGACMLMRRESFDDVGGFDEAHSVVNNDIDYCLRAWTKNQRVVYTPFTSLIHHELASRAKISDVYDETRFKGTWNTRFLLGDPYFNPNLSTEYDEYAVETEPVELVCAGHPLFDAGKVKNIIAVKLDHIGDFIIAFGAFRRLKQRFPDARLCVLAPKASAAMAALEPAIDEVIEFNFFHARSGLGVREIAEDELAALREQLAPHRFDLAIDLRMQGDTRHILQQTGASALAGFDRDGRFPWLDVTLEWEGDQQLFPKRAYVGDKLVQLVEALAVACERNRQGVAPNDRQGVSAQLLAVAETAGLPATFFGDRLVCVHPAVGSETRQWPEEYFASLIDLLTSEADIHVALIGGGDELPTASKVLDALQSQERVVSLVGKIGLKDLPLVLGAASLFIGNNSGPQHLAAALGVPTLGIHSGVVDAVEWGPLGPHAVAIRRKTVCSPCYLAEAADCHRRLACLRMLRPGDVYRAARMMLALRSPPGEDARRAPPNVAVVPAPHVRKSRRTKITSEPYLA